MCQASVGYAYRARILGTSAAVATGNRNRHDVAVLMNLLPGLRELRTPLAAGYTWLLSAWLVFYDRLPNRREAHGAVLALYQLTDVVGKPVLLTATSFAAFLIGSMLRIEPATVREILLRALSKHWSRAYLRRVPEASIFEYEEVQVGHLPAEMPPQMVDQFLSDDTRSMINGQRGVAVKRPPMVSQFAIEALTLTLRRTAEEAAPGRQVSPMAAHFIAHRILLDQGIRQLAIRLQVDRTDLFQEYDRRVAEGDFRVNVGLALSGLGLTFSLASGSPWGISSVILTLLMLRSGIYRAQTANDVVIEALVAGYIASPEINAFDQQIRRIASPRQSSGSDDPSTSS